MFPGAGMAKGEGNGLDKIRFKQGLSGREIMWLARHKMNIRGYLKNFSHDAIDMTWLKKVFSQGGSSVGLVINTGNRNEEGEHWQALWFGREGQAEFFDSYGLPPIQEGVLQALGPETGRIGGGYFDWNDEPVQDVLDKDSVACGYHCLLYLKYKDLCSRNGGHGGGTMDHFIHSFYKGPDQFKYNDAIAIGIIELYNRE